MAILSLKNVSLSYGSTKALDGVSFEHGGGFYALLGENGAGKSSLFQLLTGLYVADQGEIEIAEKSLRTHLVKVLADIGVVFQQPSLDLDMTVESNLLFFGRLRGMSTPLIQERINRDLGRLGLLPELKKPCRALSGGNRRKVELARALIDDPKLLLMDEATVGLDPASRDSLVKHVYQLCQDESISALWATHLVDEAENADRVLILHQGKLLADASPQEILQNSQKATLLDAFLDLTNSPG